MKDLCGIDEAGRGPLAGPLVMAGVVLKRRIRGLRDSKTLTAKRRDELYDKIVASADYHIVVIDADRIDDDGISACLKAGLREIMESIEAESYLFDGHTAFGIDGLACQVKADVDVPAVSAAGILAKVTRDRIMAEMDERYPHYGFKNHKGYGTAEHIEAIRTHGFSPIHRKSFKIKTLREPSLFE